MGKFFTDNEINKKEQEIEALKKLIAEKEKEVEERRERLLRELMHEDNAAAENGFDEEEGTITSDSAYETLDGKPMPKGYLNKPTVMMFFDEKDPDASWDGDDVSVMYTSGANTYDVLMCCALTLVKATLQALKDEATSEKEKERFKNFAEHVNVTKAANRVIHAVTDSVLESAGDMLLEKLAMILEEGLDNE